VIRLDVPPANDNAVAPAGRTSTPAPRPEETPVVSVPRDRAEHAYACAGNLILPLRFARRFPGWDLHEKKSVIR
jgi:hypothetical protein